MSADAILFSENDESFKLKNPGNTSYLYFPIAGETGLKSAITPNLGGDSKLDQERFLLEPTSVENLHNNKNTRNFWLDFGEGDIWSAVGSSAETEADKLTDRQEIGGYRLNTDFHELKMDMGRMFGFAYGEKENGAVFSHMSWTTPRQR